MKFKQPVSIETLSRRTMLKPDDFSARILLHHELLAHMRPTKWGWWEPANRPWDISNPQDLIPNDRNGNADRIIWTRNQKPKAEGNFSISIKPADPNSSREHAREWINCELSQLKQDPAIDYIQQSARKFDGDIAFIHFLADEEKGIRHLETKTEGCFINTVDLSFSTSTLQHWLPALPWAIVFGDAYVRMFGMDRLLSAPAHKVEKLSDDAVYIQLSPNLADLLTDYDAVHAVREKVQVHLGQDAFFDAKKAYPLRGPAGEVSADQFLKALADFRCPEPGSTGIRVPEFRLIPD